MKDPWKYLREDLFGNVEPEITLEAVTCPIDKVPHTGDKYGSPAVYERYDGESRVDWPEVEATPAIAAATSCGSREKIENDPERGKRLNRKLIKLGHHTPLEAIQFNFHLSGISTACGAQVSRHRVGQGHVSASRRFKKQAPGFIYPMLAYIEDEQVAKKWLSQFSDINKLCFERYNKMRDGDESIEQTLKKEDARLAIPVSSATERSWWINARALRGFLRLRLAADAEWEIRRLANMILDLVAPLTPSLFEDITEGPFETHD